MRTTHRHRETRKSKVLNIPSYHIVYPPIDAERLQAAMLRASATVMVGLVNRISKEEVIELFGRIEPQDFPMQLLPMEKEGVTHED